MTLNEAKEITIKTNSRYPRETDARIVRILPVDIDPPDDNDNGWDVEFTVLEECY